MRNSSFVAAGEDGGEFRGPHRMLEGEANGGTRPAGGAPADGIHNHEHGPTRRSKKLFHIGRSPCFFDAVLSEVAPHWSDQLFGIGHFVILHLRVHHWARCSRKLRI